METINLHDPVFATYAIAAMLLILKAVSMSWLTVVGMMQAKGGFRSPEDLKKAPLNPHPKPRQSFDIGGERCVHRHFAASDQPVEFGDLGFRLARRAAGFVDAD